MEDPGGPDFGVPSSEKNGLVSPPTHQISLREGEQPSLTPEETPAHLLEPLSSSSKAQQDTRGNSDPSSPEVEWGPDTAPLRTITWTAPLDWLEEILPGSPVLANLRRSLSRPPGNARTPLSVTPATIRMPAPVEPCGSAPSPVTPPVPRPAEGAGAAPLSVASVRVSGSPPNLLEGGVNSSLAEEGPISPRGKRTGTPVSVSGAAISTPPSQLSETGGTSFAAEEAPVFQRDAFTGPPGSVASPAPRESTSDFREAGGNVLEERRASVSQRDEPGTGSPASVASAALWVSPIRPSEVPLEENDSIPDTGASTSISVASSAVGASSPNVPPAGVNMEEEDPPFRQEHRTSTPLSVASAARQTPPPGPSEVGRGVSAEEDALVSQRDESTAIPASAVSPATCESVSRLLEVDGSPSKEEKASVSRQEEGASALLSAALAGSLVSPPPNDAETSVSDSSVEERAPVLENRGERSGTPLAVVSEVAWTSPLYPSEVGVGASMEAKAPASCPLGCRCHGAWTSPLSLLETEADASVEERAPAFEPGTGGYVTGGPGASSEVWATPLNLPSSRPSPAAVSSLPKTHGAPGRTPVSLASATTWTSPPALLGVGVNTSPAEKAAAKDNATETDSLLWRCSRDQLSGLSRSELEGRLESTLIIMEALSRQVRACQDVQASGAPPGPADQRDAATQTPISDPKEEERLYRDLYGELRRRHQALRRNRDIERDLALRLAGAVGEMKAWISDSGKLLETVDASYLRLQEYRRNLCLQQKELSDLFSQCRNKLQRSGQKQAEMKEEKEKALRVKEAAELALESVRNHAATRIRGLERSLESQKHLHALLQEANRCKADLFLEYDTGVEVMDCHATTLQDRWVQMRKDYMTLTSMAARCLLTSKNMAAEVEAAREEVARHREVCRKLEERTVEVVAALGRANELTEANAALEKDLTAVLQRANAAEREQEALRREKEGLSQQLAEAQGTRRGLEEEVARLSQEKEAAEQERDSAQRDAREASDCREFIEQENRIARRQLAETEEELKSTLATLRERSARLEDLKDAHRALREEREVLRGDLAASKAEIRSAGASVETFSESLLEIRAVHSQFLEMADFLRAALRGKAADATRRSSFCTPARPTPRRLGSSFVETVLQAVAEKDSRTPGLLSETTAFTKAAPAHPPALSVAEVQENLSSCIQDFQEVAAQIRLLISQHHEAALEEAQSLEAEILQLKQDLESLDNQLQAEKEAGSSNTAKLNKALLVRIQNEKELQKLMRQQDERLRTLSDQSREVVTLREEVSQLKYALQKSETEASALWEELRGTKPSDTDAVQEKIWLRQEVGKLQELLLHKDDERAEVLTKYLCQVRSLKAQLSQVKQALREHEKTEAEMKEALSTLPPDVSAASEVRRLLELLA